MHRFLRSVAGGWLVCQVIALASPIALSCDRFGLDAVICCDNLEPGAVCPMHHASPSDQSCRMSSVCAHHDAALLTILPAGAMPAADVVPVASIVPFDRIAMPAPAPLVRSERPDSPPPRG